MNYQTGKVYKIWSNLGDKIYIGSTTKQYLSQRLAKHKSDYGIWKKGNCHLTSSYLLFDEYGLENCNIELLENCPCSSKDELRAKEGEYIRKMPCVNKNLIHNSKKEKRKHFYEKNKQQENERSNKYRDEHREELNAKAKAKERYQVMKAKRAGATQMPPIN